MKNFKDFLVESKKTYKFTVRVAGELPEKFTETLETALKKYDLVNISSAKRTPITEKPLDFPQLQNLEVNHIDVEVNYPATSHVLERYITDICRVPHSHIVVRGENDPVEREQEAPSDAPYEALLTNEELEGPGDDAQKQAGGNRVMDLLKELEVARKEREADPIAGVKAGESKDIGDVENTKSPIGS